MAKPRSTATSHEREGYSTPNAPGAPRIHAAQRELDANPRSRNFASPTEFHAAHSSLTDDWGARGRWFWIPSARWIGSHAERVGCAYPLDRVVQPGSTRLRGRLSAFAVCFFQSGGVSLGEVTQVDAGVPAHHDLNPLEPPNGLDKVAASTRLLGPPEVLLRVPAKVVGTKGLNLIGASDRADSRSTHLERRLHPLELDKGFDIAWRDAERRLQLLREGLCLRKRQLLRLWRDQDLASVTLVSKHSHN